MVVEDDGELVATDDTAGAAQRVGSVAAEHNHGECGDAEEQCDDTAEQEPLHVFKPQRRTGVVSEEFAGSPTFSDTAGHSVAV